MCGRYMIETPIEDVCVLFEAELSRMGPDRPRPNVSPTQVIPVVISQGEKRLIGPMRWGFIPTWYKTPVDGPLLINARAETIAAKNAFRDAARARRCLIPVNGFYEWQGQKGAGVPHVVRKLDGGIFALAGIWQMWGTGDQRRATCAIVTCAANDTLAPVHHRMPVVVQPGDQALWLGEEGKGAARLMRPAPNDLLQPSAAEGETLDILKRRAAA